MGILRQKSDFKLTHWSGGTTTELFIYPAESDFKKRNFHFRLSIATVETETSTFTRLPGVKRKLLLLDGELTLKHKDHHQTVLKPFEWDVFNGDWETHSEGKVTDFNLMMTEGCDGNFEVIQTVETNDLLVESNADILCLYMQQGSLKCENKAVNPGALYVITKPSKSLSIKMSTNSILIIVRIKLNKVD